MLEELENRLNTQDANIATLIKRLTKLEANGAKTTKLTYTVQEAADALGMKESTIRTWIAEGKLHAIKTAKRLLIPTESLLSLIQTDIH